MTFACLRCHVTAACLLCHVTAFAGINLQAQIDCALPGDTIHLTEPVYEGNLRIDKPLTLAGDGHSIVRGDGNGSVITVLADGVELTGLTIERCGRQLMNDDAGIMIRADHCKIRNNRLNDVLFGIYFYSADSCLVEGNTIIGRDSLDLGERGSGIHFYDSHYNRILSNDITGVRDGFYVQNSNRTVFTANEVRDVRYGLHYMYSDNNSFFDNSFTGNLAGAAVMYSDSIIIRGNKFLHNRGFSSFGVLFQDCRGLVVESNVIADNVIGMFFEATCDSRIENNLIAGNDVALQMFQNSTGNAISNNNFIENLNPLIIVGKRTGTIWNNGRKGNYWSGHKGYDLDRDGIGDVPMKIHNVFEYIEGKYPLVRLYLYSPASQALAAATEAFPIFDLNEEQDDFPLMQPVDIETAVAPLRATEMTRAEAQFPVGLILSLLAFASLGGLIFGLRRRQGKR